MRKSLLRYTGLFCAVITLSSVGGAWATWLFADATPQSVSTDLPIRINQFTYAPEMPEDEVTFLERMYDLLNNQYSNDIIPEGQSMDYILSTLDKDWSVGHNPAQGSFVGSMDPTAESMASIDAMFGDVIDFGDNQHVSFIIKSEDLVGSVDNEIAIYSTSDPLTWNPNNWNMTVVGVYLSVFVPVLDDNGKTIGYEQLCDSIHGYCVEVQYMDGNNTPSFSTDHWRDELFYWHENFADPQPIIGDDRYKYECYHPADGNYAYPGRTQTWYGWVITPTNQWETGDYVGKRAREKLAELLALKE